MRRALGVALVVLAVAAPATAARGAVRTSTEPHAPVVQVTRAAPGATAQVWVDVEGPMASSAALGLALGVGGADPVAVPLRDGPLGATAVLPGAPGVTTVVLSASEPVSGRLAVTFADADGGIVDAWSTTVTVGPGSATIPSGRDPEDGPEGAAGAVTVGVDDGADEAPDPARDGGLLARTGSTTTVLLLIAVALLAAGGLLVGRRREAGTDR